MLGGNCRRIAWDTDVTWALAVLMFGRHTLADVHVPVLLYSGDGDKLVAVDKNAAALARKLPEPPDFKLLAGAGHFVFMAPCDSDQLVAMPAICTDADGVDREGIHQIGRASCRERV